jgi:hypothetical protein
VMRLLPQGQGLLGRKGRRLPGARYRHARGPTRVRTDGECDGVPLLLWHGQTLQGFSNDGYDALLGRSR